MVSSCPLLSSAITTGPNALLPGGQQSWRLARLPAEKGGMWWMGLAGHLVRPRLFPSPWQLLRLEQPSASFVALRCRMCQERSAGMTSGESLFPAACTGAPEPSNLWQNWRNPSGRQPVSVSLAAGADEPPAQENTLCATSLTESGRS